MRYKKAVFFSLDALIAMAIIFSVVLIAFPVVERARLETRVHFDIVETFSSLKISEIDNAYVQSLISDGYINDTNRSLLEQIGVFYVTNITLAKSLADSVLFGIDTNKNIGIWYANTLISSINSTPIETAENIGVARQLISGIQEGEGVTGFSARAFLTSSLQSKYFYFGGYIGDGNITIQVNYTGNISEANMELVINNDFDLYVNSILSGSYTGSASEFIPVSYSIPITNFHSGSNILEFKGQEIHVAGGFVKVVYEDGLTFDKAERYNFPGIDGLINVYDGLFIPSNLTSLEVFLHLDTSYEAFLNIGNVTVFRNSTSGEESITIPDSILSSILDYSSLVGKTIPIRLGLENISFATTLSKETSLLDNA